MTTSAKPFQTTRLGRVIAFAILITALAVGWMSWTLFQLFQHTSVEMPRALQMGALRDRLVLLDALSIMTVRMTVATGEPRWEKQYREYESQQDQSLSEVSDLGLGAAANRLLKEAQAANSVTDAIESRALELARQKQGGEAIALIEGDDYKKGEKIYSDNMMQIGNLLKQASASAQKRMEEQSRSSIVAVTAVILILFLCWGYVHALMRNWQFFLAHTNRQLNEQAAQLEAFTQELDAKVEERTKQLRESETALLNMMDDTVCSRQNVQHALDDLQREVAERKKVEAQLVQSQKMDAIGQLAGGVAHDFNNQLSVIMGYAVMLEGRLTDPKLKRYAANISTSAQRSADLTQKLLAFSRKGQFQAVPLSVHKLLAETVEMLERSIDKRIEIRQSLNAEADIIVGDPSQMQNALLNLGVNARDAMPEGGRLHFETANVYLDSTAAAKYVGEAVPGHYLRVCLNDTGTGMSDEVKRHLFEPFFTTKPIGKGTGMGLASVFGTVKNHKGVIDVYSELGHGTTFKLYLPLAEQTKIAAASTATLTRTRSLRVLLVDDEKILRDMLAEMLRSGGHEVVEAENGRQALELYRQDWKYIDVVVFDMIMPEMNGPDAFRAMKLINPAIKAILSTGFSVNKEVQTILDEGVLGFIQKPCMPNDLLNLIAKVTNAG